MLTQDITVKGFDNKEYTRTFYFNLDEDILLDHQYLQGELEVLARYLESLAAGQPASDAMRQKMTDMIKLFIKLSYGERDPDDPTRFIQDDPVGDGPVFQKFKQTRFYNRFLMDLLGNAGVATAFMAQVMPDELMSQVDTSAIDALVSETATLKAVEDVQLPEPHQERITSPTKRTWRDMTRQELLDLPAEEFDELVGTDSRAWSMDIMSIAMQRKQGGGQPSEG